jgi:hypothetical protein
VFKCGSSYAATAAGCSNRIEDSYTRLHTNNLLQYVKPDSPRLGDQQGFDLPRNSKHSASKVVVVVVTSEILKKVEDWFLGPHTHRQKPNGFGFWFVRSNLFLFICPWWWFGTVCHMVCDMVPSVL